MGQVLVDIPQGGITNAMIASSPPVSASKLTRHQSIDVELYGPAVTVAALTKWLHIVRGGSGTLIGFEAAIAVVATGADRTITVDLQKSTGAGSFATVLSSTCGFTNVSAVRTPVAAVISSAGIVDGDILEVVVTVAGSASAQATGLTVTLTYEETYV